MNTTNNVKVWTISHVPWYCYSILSHCHHWHPHQTTHNSILYFSSNFSPTTSACRSHKKIGPLGWSLAWDKGMLHKLHLDFVGDYSLMLSRPLDFVGDAHLWLGVCDLVNGWVQPVMLSWISCLSVCLLSPSTWTHWFVLISTPLLDKHLSTVPHFPCLLEDRWICTHKTCYCFCSLCCLASTPAHPFSFRRQARQVP